MMRVWLTLGLVASLALTSASAAQQEVAEAKPQHAHHAEEASKPAAPAKQPVPFDAIQQLPNQLHLSHSMVQALAVGGVVFVGLVAAIGLISWFSGFKLCYLLNNCDSYAHAYMAPSHYDYYSQPLYPSPALYAKSYNDNNDLSAAAYAYEGYPQHATQVSYPTSNSLSASAYQKRSLEYVGPILKMLSNAYEKYSHPSQTKSFVETPKLTTSSAPPTESLAE